MADYFQKPLKSEDVTPSKNYSVGFSLSSSYGAAAVIIDDAHGEQKTLTWVVYGDASYQETMAKLSLVSSKHLAYVSITLIPRKLAEYLPQTTV